MPRSWDDGLSPKERANVVRRLRAVWALDLSLDELPDEMALCLRCWRKPGTAFRCPGCGGNPEIAKTCACGGGGMPEQCDLCGGSGLMSGWSVETVVALALELGLPADRPDVGYLPTEDEIRLAKAKMRLRRPDCPSDLSQPGRMNSEGDNGGGGGRRV